MSTICLYEKYSTTRLLTKERPVIGKNPEDKFETVLSLPKGEGRNGEGGLRTKGYFKKSLPDKPLITVVTVVFNGEKYLEETILSVITQTYDNVEYIIIDGGSTDGTLDIIKRYEEKVDYWVSEKDEGISDAFNKGIICATGKYLQMLNAGDLYLNIESLRLVVRKLKKGIITFQAVTDTGNIFPIYKRKKTQIAPENIEEAKNNATLAHQATFVRDNVYKAVGLYRSSLKIRMDFDMFFRIQRKFNIICINKPVIYYRTDGISSKFRNRLIFKLEELKIINSFYFDKRYIIKFYFTLPVYLIKKWFSSIYYFVKGRVN